VYEDRARHLGDPDYMDMRTADLLDTSYLDKRFMSIDPKRAGKSPNLAVPLGEESSETTHFSILDKEGNSIAITTTLNASYGSRRWVSGFFMNNEMDDFSISPGVPNQFGLIGFEANSIEPGKRMLSSMTPTILVKGDQKVVLGTPGGSTIITNVFQVIRRFCRFGQTLQESVNSKKIHAQAWPEVLYLEEGSFTKKVLRKLKKKGHKIEFKKQIGRFQAVSNGKTAPDVLRTGDSAGRVIFIE
jgi:gamma-glutamyltranspeptidase/glutathione hydrolase